MKNLLILLFSLAFYSNVFAQNLVLHQDFPGTLTWPFLWDLEQDGQGNLYVCSEQGKLYIKSDNLWQEYDLNVSTSNSARSIAIDNVGIVWVGTEDGLYSLDNGIITHFTSSNSQLPSDDIIIVRAFEDKLWIVLRENGLALKEGNNFTHYTSSNSNLPDNDVEELEITNNGSIFLAADEIVTIIDQQWTDYDFKSMFGSGTWVNDIYIDHNQDVWFANFNGVIKYNSGTGQFENLKSEYGEKKYTQILFTPSNELWLNELLEGLHYFDNQGNNYFFEGNINGQPSQVFDFIYYNDTLRVVGNIGSSVTGLTIAFLDNDGDGFTSDIDCDDTNPDINPDADEIANNGIDEDCDGMDLLSSTYEISNSTVKIYPNPATDVINISVIGNLEFEANLYDLQGRLIQSSINDSKILINSIPKGNYIIEIKDLQSDQKLTERIAIEK